MTVLFDKDFLGQLEIAAQQSERRRSNSNLHDGPAATVQKLFISMMPDSYVRPHRHNDNHKSECFIVIAGALDFLLFDDDGALIERIHLSSDGGCRGLDIPPHVWHANVCDAPVTFFEVKQGPYVVETDKEFAHWAPAEGAENVKGVLTRLKHMAVGDKLT